jgi:hypothetical protein
MNVVVQSVILPRVLRLSAVRLRAALLINTFLNKKRKEIPGKLETS